MHRSTGKWCLLAAPVALCLVMAGDAFVLQRTGNDTDHFLTIRGDTHHYVSMIRGDWEGTPAPFRFRVLAPLAAALLPFSPADSLKWVSYVGLFFCYLFILLACRASDSGVGSCVVGLLAVCTSTWHLYHYHNPFLTDALALSMLCVMTFAMLSDRFVLFIAAAVLGVLARETCFFLIPAWLATRRYRQGIIAIGAGAVALLVPRLILWSGTDPGPGSWVSGIGPRNGEGLLAWSVFSSWGFVWLLALIGIWFLPNGKFTRMAAMGAALVAGAILTSLVASDTGRMFSILTPVMAVAGARLHHELTTRGPWLAVILVGLVIARAPLSFPNVLIGAGGRMPPWPRVALLVAETLFLIVVLIHLFPLLRREVGGRIAHVIGNRGSRGNRPGEG